jgi:hypothetical protein
MGNQSEAQEFTNVLQPSMEESCKQEQLSALAEHELMTVSGGRLALPVFGFLMNE